MSEQGTEEWFKQRLGKVTSSRVKDVMSKGRGGKPSATRANYMMQLVCERMTGTREESFTSTAMQRGTDLEPLARALYEIETESIVKEVGFIEHPDQPNTGSSPDGLVGDTGLIEIKCPNTAAHVQCLTSGDADAKYFWQMQHQMACTGREWCDFASYDDRMPARLQLFVKRVRRDDEAIEKMMDEIVVFLEELQLLENKLNEIGAK